VVLPSLLNKANKHLQSIDDDASNLEILNEQLCELERTGRDRGDRWV